MIEMEPSKFDYDSLAETYDHWYDTAEGAMYDRLEKQAVSDLLLKNTHGEKLLDVGCGTGHWSDFFSQLGFTVTGVDISPEMIRVADRKNVNRASFQIADAHHLPFKDETFDVSVAITTLEFVRNPAGVIYEMARCTRPSNGKLIFGVLNCRASINRKRKMDGNQPYSSGQLFSPRQIRNMLEPYGEPKVFSTAFVPTMNWLLFMAPILNKIKRLLYLPTGALVIGSVEL